jgi:hypothetical protein
MVFAAYLTRFSSRQPKSIMSFSKRSVTTIGLELNE